MEQIKKYREKNFGSRKRVLLVTKGSPVVGTLVVHWYLTRSNPSGMFDLIFRNVSP